MKKMLAFLLVLMMALPCASALAETMTYESDFSAGTDGWYARSAGGAAIEVTDEGLLTTGRTATWNSPGRAFDLAPGETYQISVELKQDMLESGRFILSVEHSVNGQTSYENLNTQTAKKGEWVTLSANYVAGEYETFVLYVEGGEADTEYTIRNFTLTGAAPSGQETAYAPFFIPNSEQELMNIFNIMTPRTSMKQATENNPLFTQRFGADPGVLVWNDRLYVYTTNDIIEYDAAGNVKENSYGLVKTINCISSADLVNWTDHGAIPVAGRDGIAKWASNSWAPCAAHKTIDGQEKFFLYFCNGGNGVSVLTADDPAGPWTDPLGHGLITRDVPNCANVLWLFDPAVFVDEDGTGYLYFGGGVPDGQQASPKTGRVVQLGEDMISIVGTPETIDAPYFFEDSGMNRIGDTYYYTYCSNWNTDGNSLGLTSGAIEYMTADSPMGPFTYGGELFPNEGRFFGLYGNNHHSIVEFRDQMYLVYHNRPVEKAMGITGNYRSPQMDKLTVNEDGSIVSVVGTMKGPDAQGTLNPYESVPATTMAREAGMEVIGYGSEAYALAATGDWMQVKNADFASGAAKLTLRMASPTGGAVKVCLGDEKGTAIAYIMLPAWDGMADYTVDVDVPEGVQDVTFVFAGNVRAESWQFTSK